MTSPARRLSATAALTFVALFGSGATAQPFVRLGPLHDAARRGDVRVIAQWIAEKRNLDEIFNDRGISLEGNGWRVRGVTPLMVAAEAGQLTAVRALVDGGANLYAESGTADGRQHRNVFEYAVDGGSVPVAAYVWEKSDRKRFTRSLDRQLALACRSHCNDRAGDTAATNLALFLAGITRDDALLGSAIGRVACRADALPALRFLVAHGVPFPPNTLQCLAANDSYDQTAGASRIEVAKFLLQKGADPNAAAPEPPGATPLIQAAQRNDLDLVDLLLKHGADPERQDGQGRKAINAAADSCSLRPPSSTTRRDFEQLAVVEKLVAAGARAVPKPDSTLARCCARPELLETNVRICGIFGLTTR